MTYKNLQEFIHHLEKNNNLIRVKESVSSVLEITEIHKRTIEKAGPAIIFENVYNEHTKSKMPVIVNLFGTVERIAMSLGTTTSGLRDIGRFLAFLKNPEPPSNFSSACSTAWSMRHVLCMKTKIINNPPCQELIFRNEQIDLTQLPIQTCWPKDIAPLISWPIVITQDPITKMPNLGIYRMQILNKNQTLMRWLAHRGGARHHALWKKYKPNDFSGTPAAIVIGIDPATILAATMPIPENMSEYSFAGILRKKSTVLTKCLTIPIDVPAEAEIVIEGIVSFSDEREEGPYGDHTGYYNSVEKFPVFNITAITTRKKPIYLSTFTGRAPDEPSVIGEALNEIFIPVLQTQFPEIHDFFLPPEGCSYRIAIVSIDKQYQGHANRIIMGMFSFLKQFLYTKIVIVVDKHINIRSWKDVMWAISTKADPSRDFMTIDRSPIDYLDFSSVLNGMGGKIGIDATDKPYPETNREWGEELKMSKNITDIVTKKWNKYGIKLNKK